MKQKEGNGHGIRRPRPACGWSGVRAAQACDSIHDQSQQQVTAGDRERRRAGLIDLHHMCCQRRVRARLVPLGIMATSVSKPIKMLFMVRHENGPKLPRLQPSHAQVEP